MKSSTSLNRSAAELPTTAAQRARVLAQAPKSSAGQVKAQAGRADAVVVKSGGYRAVQQALAKKRQGQRGPQHSPTKQPVTVRYSPDVLAYFQASGAGWQTRMSDALRDWVAHQPAA